MTTAKQISQFLNQIAPFDTAMDFDNVGLLVGIPRRKLHPYWFLWTLPVKW